MVALGEFERGREFRPPVSPTGVETEQVTLGWLAGTASTDVGHRGEQGHADRLVSRIRAVAPGVAVRWRGNRAYRDGICAPDWSWLVGWEGQGGAAGTVLVELRQSFFEARGISANTLAFGLCTDGVRPSRIDLAGDVPEPATRPHEWFDRWDTARSHVPSRSVVLQVQRDGPEKLSIGARGGERYLRIYDKPERGCVRHELELRGARSRAVGLVLGMAPLAVLWAEQYAGFVRW